MRSVKNEHGAVIVFVTLMIVLLLVIVGMGLDTGHLAYIRSQGQPAVDAAALAAAAAIPTGKPSEVKERAKAFNYGEENAGGNNYVDSPQNLIDTPNVTLIRYDWKASPPTVALATGVTSESVGDANGARVALENSNPYGGTAGAAMTAPLFLTPLLNLFGFSAPGTSDVSVSAVAVKQAIPGLPIVVAESLCGGTTVTLDFQSGGKSTAGWETYHLQNASTSQVRALFEGLPTCQGQPLVDVGYCGYIANGVNETIVNGTLKPMFKAEPDRCYLIPVIKNGGNFNQCQKITDWASFCPDKEDPFPSTGKLKGTVTCGENIWDSTDTKCYVTRLVRDVKSGM